jgi:tellurite methyltransferase
LQNTYDKQYNQEEYYWGKKPSALCHKILEMMPPEKPLKVLDVGCGEGRNAVFFAKNGYEVTAFDLSPQGVEKTKLYADEIGVKIKAFQANLIKFRLEEKFDIIFSIAALHYIPLKARKEILDNYKKFTTEQGLNVHSVFVNKPFIPKAPDAQETAHLWISGEVFSYYHDWKIEFCEEEIFNCRSSGIPHKHAANRLIARKI